LRGAAFLSGAAFLRGAAFLAATLRFAAFFLPFLARLPARAAAPVFFFSFFVVRFPFLRPGRLDFAFVRAIKPPVLRG
jgi:hypothetical protein